MKFSTLLLLLLTLWVGLEAGYAIGAHAHVDAEETVAESTGGLR